MISSEWPRITLVEAAISHNPLPPRLGHAHHDSNSLVESIDALDENLTEFRIRGDGRIRSGLRSGTGGMQNHCKDEAKGFRSIVYPQALG